MLLQQGHRYRRGPSVSGPRHRPSASNTRRARRARLRLLKVNGGNRGRIGMLHRPLRLPQEAQRELIGANDQNEVTARKAPTL